LSEGLLGHEGEHEESSESQQTDSFHGRAPRGLTGYAVGKGLTIILRRVIRAWRPDRCLNSIHGGVEVLRQDVPNNSKPTAGGKFQKRCDMFAALRRIVGDAPTWHENAPMLTSAADLWACDHGHLDRWLREIHGKHLLLYFGEQEYEGGNYSSADEDVLNLLLNLGLFGLCGKAKRAH